MNWNFVVFCFLSLAKCWLLTSGQISTSQCGLTTGQQSANSEPWMAKIMKISCENQQQKEYCNAIFLSKQWILTDGKCVDGGNLTRIELRLVYINNFGMANTVPIVSLKRLTHVDSTTNLMLVKIAQPVLIVPICVPTTFDQCQTLSCSDYSVANLDLSDFSTSQNQIELVECPLFSGSNAKSILCTGSTPSKCEHPTTSNFLQCQRNKRRNLVGFVNVQLTDQSNCQSIVFTKICDIMVKLANIIENPVSNTDIGELSNFQCQQFETPTTTVNRLEKIAKELHHSTIVLATVFGILLLFAIGFSIACCVYPLVCDISRYL